MSWHGNREEVFEVMRKLSLSSLYNWEKAREFGPRNNEVMVGGADFDFTLKATIIDSYLRILRKGGTPKEALQEAIKDGQECIDIWNNKTSKSRVSIHGNYELQRWPGSANAIAQAIHSHFTKLE